MARNMTGKRLILAVLALVLLAGIVLVRRRALSSRTGTHQQDTLAQDAPPPTPRAIPRWDDEGGALPEGPQMAVPAGPTVE